MCIKGALWSQSMWPQPVSPDWGTSDSPPGWVSCLADTVGVPILIIRSTQTGSLWDGLFPGHAFPTHSCFVSLISEIFFNPL